ncbi:aminoglycoside 6'-N-acetyltransferase [Marinactinospora thermotolerans DSM 45154]|uniref:Aminoglycoside 6'-N-acetyltransferase n=1 Tax=Marinactinospora thermotolerans DSM 45154 TaxID=1122192 RepID=A0A1T4TGL2_9ACTN|nr:GNAT family protein [Marinactinospora thermotolerans]SKA39570.1 aminoglycoside 6'-N-acetyltransferase [Marinactinospora thermotolerans DSM 45154]
MPDPTAPVPAEPVELVGPRATLRPWTAEDGPELNRIVTRPEVACWWGEEDFALPTEGGEQRYAIVVEGRVRGMIQFYEEPEPDYRHAGIDVFLDPDTRGLGLGVEVIVTLARWLFDERGHHRIVIDPALDNTAAVRAYEKAGFRRVGVMRSYWRDPEGHWRDGLLMDMLADDLPAAAAGRSGGGAV